MAFYMGFTTLQILPWTEIMQNFTSSVRQCSRSSTRELNSPEQFKKLRSVFIIMNKFTDMNVMALRIKQYRIIIPWNHMLDVDACKSCFISLNRTKLDYRNKQQACILNVRATVGSLKENIGDMQIDIIMIDQC